jgi:molybdate transport system ATP-binding protein
VRLRDEAKIPMVYVSHQAGEIVRLASQVVRVEDGKVQAIGGLELLDVSPSEMVY